MFKPTPAEKKAILARLPKPPEGKVWKQYTGDQKAQRGSYIVTYHAIWESLSHGVGLCDLCEGFLGRKASSLASHESTWRLVAARKRPAKTIYYRPSEDHPVGGDTNRWTAKLSGYADHIYRPNGSYESNGSKESFGWAKGARGNIKSGVYSTITRAEFLSRIKGYGLNEDGTKIVAPPKVRYFIHLHGFGGGTAYVRHDGDNLSRSVCVQTDGREVHTGPYLSSCEEYASSPKWDWKEVTESEAKALIPKALSPKTELERLKEALTAANARISELEAKIASAKEVLS